MRKKNVERDTKRKKGERKWDQSIQGWHWPFNQKYIERHIQIGREIFQYSKKRKLIWTRDMSIVHKGLTTQIINQVFSKLVISH